MAEHKKLSMLVKLDDGQTYTLGGDNADNAVTLDTEQTITGLKTFDKLPQSSVKPANDHDLVNKVYVDALKPKLKTTVMLNVESESTSWAAFHSIKFSTTTGKFIEPVYLEDTVTSTAVEPLKFVFKLADSFTGNATARNKDFFKDYQLQDGEYFGSFTPSHLLEARWSVHSSNEQANPFSNYLASLTTGPNSVLPYLEYHFDGLSDELKQVEFDIGDIYNSNKYPPAKFQVVVSTGAKEFTSKVYTSAADSISKGSHHTVEFKLKTLEFVTLDTAQTITGKKTFTVLPQSKADPKADAELITKGYADGHYLPVDTKPHKYDILVKMKHDGNSWVGFSDFSVRLRDGTRLDVKHIENQSATTATQPVKAVFKTVKDLNAPIEAPTQQPATFFDSYSLEAGEFTGTVSFYKVVGKFGPAQIDINPWYVYVGSGNANNYDGIYAVSIDNLDKPLLGVNFKFGDAHTTYVYTCLQCGVVFTVDGSALEVAYDGDMADGVEATIEYPISAQSMIGVVTLDTEQTITAVKTFKVLPQSEAVPADDKDLVNKKYVDAKTGGGSIKTSLLIKAYPYVVPRPFAVWEAGYQDLKISLEDNKHLVPLYLEATSAKDATAAINVIYKVSDTEYVKGSIQQQAKEWFNTYELKEGEVKGLIYFANVLNDNLQNSAYSKCLDPFDDYAADGSRDQNGSLIKFLFVDLPLKIREFSFKLGATSQKSLPQSIQVFGSSGSERYTSALLDSYIDDFKYGQKRTFHISFVNEEYVGLRNDQVISGKKVFEVTPELKNPPVGSNEVATKGYVDGLLNVPQKCVVRIKAKNVAGQKSIGITRPRLYLSNGMVLQATHATESRKNSANCAVFKPVPASDKEFPAPEESTWSLMEQIVKQDKTLVFANIKMGNASDSSIPNGISNPCARDLFVTNGVEFDLAGTTSTEVTPVTFEFDKLPAPVTSLGLYSHWNGKHVQSNTSEYKYEVDFGSKSAVSPVVETNTMEDYKYTTLEAAVANSIIDYTDVKQNITALKTFDVLPQSKATPTDEKDFVTKKFLDAAIAELDRRIKALEAAKI